MRNAGLDEEQAGIKIRRETSVLTKQSQYVNSTEDFSPILEQTSSAGIFGN